MLLRMGANNTRNMYSKHIEEKRIHINPCASSWTFKRTYASVDVLDPVKLSIVMSHEDDIMSAEQTEKCRVKPNFIPMCSKTRNQRCISRRFGSISYLKIILLLVMSV
jgi:hypothetical protein